MANPSNLDVKNNTIENVNIGLAANQVLGAQITHNEITGPSPEIFGSSGLLISGRDSYVFENEFTRLDTGILLFVEDSQLGSATNTVIDENDFNHVAMDIMTSPGAPVMMMAAASAQGTPTLTWTKLPHR
jgi:hypothetical protein